jgi:hypothetical protein
MDKGKYLDSWKDIAVYLGRNIRTCRNWERDLGLPVHRLDDSSKAHVFAYTGELDAWREVKGRLPENEETGTGDTEAPNQPSAPDTAPIRRSVRTWFVVASLAALFLAFVAVAFVARHPRSLPGPPAGRFTIKVEPGHWLEGESGTLSLQRPSRTAMAISSDGRFLVYCAIDENPGLQAKPQLYLRKMDRTEAKPIPGTEGGISPFLSPDDRWVGFWADGKLKKVLVEGGVPTDLCDAPEMFGANWGRDGSIVFAGGEMTGLSRVSAGGGKPETLTVPDPKREETSHRLPFWLPNGKAVLFTVERHSMDTRPWLALLRLDTREWHALLQDAADARYVPTGHLVFMRQGTLMAVRFDPTRMETIGHPVALVENVVQALAENNYINTGAGQFCVSDAGTLIYAAGGLIPPTKDSLVWVDQKGIETPVTDLRSPFFAPRLSPDGSKIAYLTYGREWRVWVYDLLSGTNSPLTGEGMAFYPIWSPDGKRLLFSWYKSLQSSLYWQPYDGSSAMERFTTGEWEERPGSWSADGNKVAIVRWPAAGNADIVVMDVPSKRVTPFLNSQFVEEYPEFSPDGRWIAYSSDESKRKEVYVRPFPGSGMKRLVSTKGGYQPLWARDGKKLFYRWEDQFWVVDVQIEGSFAAGKPRLLFEKAGIGDGYPIRTYDLSLDGQRFLMVREEPLIPAPVTEMILIQNWFQELKRLVPAGKKGGT